MLLKEAASADHAGARVRAMELLGKWRGMFAEHVEVNHKISVAALLMIVAKTHPHLASELAPLLGNEDWAEPTSAE
jgi:hypothetical protein